MLDDEEIDDLVGSLEGMAELFKEIRENGDHATCQPDHFETWERYCRRASVVIEALSQ